MNTRAQPHIPSRPAEPGPAATLAELRRRAPELLRRFLSLRPELEGPAGRRGAALVLTWWNDTARRELSWRRAKPGELFWVHLAGSRVPQAQDLGVVVDAAAGFLWFAAARAGVPHSRQLTLHRDARLEGMAYLAHSMGLLPHAEVAVRRRQYALRPQW